MAIIDPRVTSFGFRRQRLDGSAPDALAAVRAAVAVYGSMPSGPLSIRARAPGVHPADVRALEQERRVVRMRAMRTSSFLVARSDAALLGAATAAPASRRTWLLREAGMSEAELAAVAPSILAVAAEPGTPAEIRARLAAWGLDHASAPWTRVERLGRVLSLLKGLGTLVAVGGESLSSNALRYVDARAWLGDEARDATGGDDPAAGPGAEAARAWLAGAYLAAFGPARLTDLAWWAGWSRAQAGAAAGAHATVEIGDGLLLLASDLAAFEETPPLPGAITLLPKWDAWTMGYPLDGRGRFLDRDVHDRVFDGDGNGLAVVLRGGRAIGAWAHRGVGATMQADLDLFERETPRVAAALEDGLGAIATFLGYRGLTLRRVTTVVPNRRRQRRPLDP